MSEQIDDGGPAFPRPESQGQDGWWRDAQGGMSLRDWFAGQCDPSVYNPMETLTRDLGHKPTVEEMAKWVAATRLIEADEILKIKKSKI